MDVGTKELRIYETKDGKAPFSDWLTKLKDVSARGVIRTRLNRVRLGNLGDCKSIGDGVSELRIDFGPGYRVYFAIEGKNLVILLVGGSKASQRKDIERAKDYWKDYRRRSNE
ncbi:MAG: type II toxin-antitoxin system RelE/ParE family toxin [Deltaproteobacteria bacterium]